MLRFYAEKGFPPGPFAKPAPVYTAASGRGKIHAHSRCQAKLSRVEKYLWDVRKSDYCTKCVSTVRTLPHHDYIQVMDELLNARTKAVNTATKISRVASQTLAGRGLDFDDLLDRWAELVIAQYQVNRFRHAHGPELTAWIRENLDPEIDVALGYLAEEMPILTSPHRAARITALQRHLGFHDGHLSGCVATADTTVFRSNADAYRFVRAEVRRAWLRQVEPDEEALNRVAVEAAEEFLSREPSRPWVENLTQLPLEEDAVPVCDGESLREYLTRMWRRKAHTLLTEFGAVLAAHLVQDAYTVPDDPGVVVGIRLFDVLIGSTDVPAALMIATGTIYTAAEQAGAVAVMPRCVYDQLPHGRYGIDFGVSLFGDAEPGDTVDTYNIARLLQPKMDEPGEALQMARLSGLQAHAFVTA